MTLRNHGIGYDDDTAFKAGQFMPRDAQFRIVICP